MEGDKKIMDLLELKWERDNLVLTIHWILILICVFIAILVTILVVFNKKKHRSKMEIESYTVTVGGVSTTLKIDYSDREIAYKAWVEMSTRKVGLMVDDEKDVIVEVYNSWYEFFKILRNIMKEIPGNKFTCSHDLIDLLSNVLNGRLRNHLTTWQAKFRRWYDFEIIDTNNKDKSPQDIQREYPEFSDLIKDIKETNEELIDLKTALYSIAFDCNKK